MSCITQENHKFVLTAVKILKNSWFYNLVSELKSECPAANNNIFTIYKECVYTFYDGIAERDNMFCTALGIHGNELCSGETFLQVTQKLGHLTFRGEAHLTVSVGFERVRIDDTFLV